MDLDPSILDRELQGLETEGGGRVGAAVALGRMTPLWSFRGQETFPLAGISKFMIALAVLAKVDRREIHPEQIVTIRRADLAPGSSPIAAEFIDESERFTVRGLLARAVTLNDNTAADALTHLLGGTAAITAQLRRWGISGIRVDRLERELQPSVAGLVGWQPEWAGTEAFARSTQMLPEQTRRAALTRYLQDAEDRASPLAVVKLLTLWSRGLLLSPRGGEVLTELLNESPMNRDGLREGLPAGWKLVHQTGTAPDVCGIGPATNAIGVMTSPKGAQLFFAVFIAGSAAPLRQRQEAIARIGRTGRAALEG